MVPATVPLRPNIEPDTEKGVLAGTPSSCLGQHPDGAGRSRGRLQFGMRPAAIEQYLYLVDEAFEAPGNHPLLSNLRSVGGDDDAPQAAAI